MKTTLREKKLVKIGIIEYDENSPELGHGTFGCVYQGKCCPEHGDIAVKRVLLDCLDEENDKDKLGGELLKHSNYVVKLFHVEDDVDCIFRYYALELCNSSMNRLFLPKDDAERFEIDESLLSNISKKKVLLQLAIGLEYIHSNNICHRDVKPENVLISINMNSEEEKDGRVIFKWSDFGICKKVSQENKTYTLSDVRGTKYWIAPEVTKMAEIGKPNIRGSTMSDVWSAGCVFFYYLTEGNHPFGELRGFSHEEEKNMLGNIISGDPKKLRELPFSHFAYDTIEKMIKLAPGERSTAAEIVTVLSMPTIPAERKIFYDEKDNLNKFQSVFSGKYNTTTRVAVKRIPLNSADPDLGLKVARLEHPNLVKLLFAENVGQFSNFALELCAGSLRQILDEIGEKKYRGYPLPTYGEGLISLMQGLEFIHSKGLVHGRIEPEKVLVSEIVNPSSGMLTLKWADFGLFQNGTGPSISHYNYFVPEKEQQGAVDDKKGDIWCAGAVFFHFLSEGKYYNETNPMLAVANNAVQEPFKNVPLFYRELVERMMSKEPEERIQLGDAIELLTVNIGMANKFKEMCSSDTISITKESLSELGQIFHKIDLDGLETARIDMDKQMDTTNLSALCQRKNEPADLHTVVKVLLNEYEKREHTPRNDSDGTNALYWLFQRQHIRESQLEIVKSMVGIGIDLNAHDKNNRSILHSICENYRNEDLLDIIRLMISSKQVKLNAKDSEGRTALHFLGENYQNDNLIQIIQFMIDEKVHVKAKDKFQNTALHWLCQKYPHDDLMEIIELLIKEGADVKAKDENESTVLHRLSLNPIEQDKMIDVVDFLIKKGVDLNDSGPVEESTLHAFCKNYKRENLINIIKELVRNGANVNAKDTAGDTALDYLCECYRNENLKDIIEYMILSGSDIQSKGAGGKTALHWLCEDYQYDNLYDIIKLLIYEKGLDAKMGDSENLTALDWLQKNDRLSLDVKNDVIELLLNSKYAEDPSSSSSNDEEIKMLILCSSASITEEVATRLCDIFNRRKNLNSFDAENGRTALSLVCKNGAAGEHRLRAITFFLKTYKERAVRPDNDSDGTNALFWLFQHSEITETLSEIVKEMIEIGVEVNVKDCSKRTTFHSICENYRNEDLPKIVELIMKKRVYVNAKDLNQRTSLHWLSQNYKNENLLDIFQYLVDNADDLLLDDKDSDGKTVLHLLCTNYGNENLFDIIKLLIDYYDVRLNVVDLNGKIALHYLRENYSKANLEEIAKLVTVNNKSFYNDKDEEQHEHKLLIEPTTILLDNNNQDNVSFIQLILTRLNLISYEWIIISFLCLIIAIQYKFNST